ncbi:hypothetical protein DAD79_12455 [Bacillus sp. Rc4]|nr:hypothetical protein DAD79_12455 [Bacillus sp. Rc4]
MENGGGGASLLFINSKMRRTAPGLMVYNIVKFNKNLTRRTREFVLKPQRDLHPVDLDLEAE